ncbi:hypothetical protein [Streptomyces sp. NPDC003952]
MKQKQNTAPEAITPAQSAPRPPTAPPGEPRGIFLFAVPTAGRAHHREDYAPIR